MKSVFNSITIILLLLLVVLITLTYHPRLQDMSGGEEGSNILSSYVVIVFALLFVVTFRWKYLIQFITIKICLICVLLFNLTLMILFSVYGENIVFETTRGFYVVELFSTMRAYYIVLVAILIGWQLNISDKALKSICYILIGLILFTVICQIFKSFGGLIIETQYKTGGKNATGALVASAMILSFLFFLEKHKTTSMKILFLLMGFACFVCLLTIRARTASLMAILLMIFIVFRKIMFNKRKLLLSTLGLILLIFLVYFVLPNAVWNYIYDSFTLGHESDITSDRTERNRQALVFLQDNLLLGNIEGKAQVAWVHNFLLLQLYNFGIIGSMFVLVLYFYLFTLLIKGLFKKNIFELRNVGYVMMAVSFGISLAEPTFPFGPGTCNVFNFIMFGVALRYNYLKQIKLYE